MKTFSFLFALIIASSCSGPQETEQQKIMQRNAKVEQIYRFHDEYIITLPEPNAQSTVAYPWETN